MRRPVLLAAVLLAALASLAPPAAAAPSQVEISDVEDEVMCPICGTLLELADAPQARRQKAFIAEMIAAGRTKAEIKEALVAQYGRDVLALPRGSGFDLSAYLVPAIAFVFALAALAVGVWRWRRRGASGPPPGPGPSDADAERLDTDIARYDL